MLRSGIFFCKQKDRQNRSHHGKAMSSLEPESVEEDGLELGPMEAEGAASLASEECGQEQDQAALSSWGLEWLASREKHGQDD